MSKQKEILSNVANHYGLTIAQAEEVWALFNQVIYNTISNTDKKTDGIYDPEKFPVIHIDNFGKFIPNQRKIRHANFCLKKNESNS